MLVSLVPTAIILAAAVAGRDQNAGVRARGADGRSITSSSAESQQASVAVAPAMLIQPRPAEAPKAEIVLTAPGRLEAKTGEELAFDITIDSDDALPARSVIAIRAMPDGRHLLARPALWRHGVEFAARRDRRSHAQAAESAQAAAPICASS